MTGKQTLVILITLTLASVADAKKKKTVSDVLNAVDSSSRGTNISIKKKSVALPDAVINTAASKSQLSQIKPPKSNEIMVDSGSDEEKIEAITDQQINELYKLTRQYGKGKNRGQLWLRLAEAYVEKSKYVEMRLQKAYDDKLALFQAKKGPAPKLNLKPAYEYNHKAIKLYEWYLRDFKNDPKAEQAIFFLGYNYMEMGQLEKGIGFYQRLTRQYPHSPYITEANFALGDFYFDNNKIKDAYHYYSQVIKNRRARLYTFGLYKLAWCQFRMEKPREAINSLEEVIRVSRAGAKADDTSEGGKKSVGKIRLGSEALKDLVLFYSEGGNYKSASEYFLRIGGPNAQYPMLEKLAYLYSDQGKKEEARFEFKALLEHNPTAPKAFDYQYQIVQNYSSLKNQPSYRHELYAWIDGFGPGSQWADANKDNKRLIDDSNTLRETALRNYTLMIHKNSQNSQKKFDMLQAKEAYKLYLSKFDSGPKSTEMHFFYAELLFALGEFNDAAKEYTVVSVREPKGKYFELAVLNALLSLEKKLKSDAEIKSIVGNSLNPVPFGDSESQFITAADKYVYDFPNADKAVDVKFKIGRLNYGYNHFDDALRIFRQITVQYPRTPFAVYSANLILDIHNLRKDYDSLAKEGLALMKNRNLTEQGFQADVRNLVESASFKKAQDLEVAKNYEGSAKAFAEFAKNYPQSSLAASAAYNSGINYERAGNFPGAITMYQHVQASSPKGNEKVKQKSALLLGRLYEQTGQYTKAALIFEKYANENREDKLSPDLYYNAAVIWEGQEESYRAIKDYEKYFESTKRRDRTQVYYTIAKIHERAHQWTAAEEYYRKFIDSGDQDGEKVIESIFRIGEIKAKKGQHAEAEKEFARTVVSQRNRSQKGKNIGASWAAESKFKLSDKTYDELLGLRIPSNPKKQPEIVQKKLALLTKLTQELTDVIKYDDGNMVIAALTRLGKAYDHMGAAIYAAPLPRDLNTEELAKYKVGVDGLARPLLDKALEDYTQAVSKSYQINFYNNWTKIALEALSKKQPDKFGEMKEIAIPELRIDDMGMLQ